MSLWSAFKTQDKARRSVQKKHVSYVLNVADVSIEVTRKVMKNVRLRVVGSEGRVRVSAPHCYPESALREFLHERLPWIRKQQTRLRHAPTQTPIDNSPEARRKLAALIEKYLPLWEQRLGVKASGFGVRAMQTRWGSCNVRTRKIWLSMMLAHRDEALIEYVLVHELIHLIEVRHSARFYQIMEQAIPRWKELHRALHNQAEQVTL
ncbi:M48 family metallopeptidase [Aliidiomarina sanyensis]|uniref:YgjP-like metallopeptidase domain-containing protein n=1 Tax=Aliidiomarina sanyensis TaxID=1249555 RepID=A0A432WS90_9GAMM|nr:YgjP-like metallopeptidase domain-containing protein [Aliidiomarina sanyensis]RUO36618.1 hypothetical protein CWE11_02060 [Aliidiomarina sanyensis]